MVLVLWQMRRWRAGSAWLRHFHQFLRTHAYVALMLWEEEELAYCFRGHEAICRFRRKACIMQFVVCRHCCVTIHWSRDPSTSHDMGYVRSFRCSLSRWFSICVLIHECATASLQEQELSERFICVSGPTKAKLFMVWNLLFVKSCSLRRLVPPPHFKDGSCLFKQNLRWCLEFCFLIKKCFPCRLVPPHLKRGNRFFKQICCPLAESCFL